MPQDDSKDFFKGLQEETAFVENTVNLEPDESDFEPMPEGVSENYSDIPTEEEPTERVNLSDLADPEETADICITMIDGVQTPIFLLLHRKKLVKKYFTDKQQYKDASEIYALTDADIANQYPDKADALLALKRRFNAMTKDYTSKTVEVPLSDDEKDRLKSPMKRMIEKSGFNVPPALALCVVMGQIIISRLIDLYWD